MCRQLIPIPKFQHHIEDFAARHYVNYLLLAHTECSTQSKAPFGRGQKAQIHHDVAMFVSKCPTDGRGISLLLCGITKLFFSPSDVFGMSKGRRGRRTRPDRFSETTERSRRGSGGKSLTKSKKEIK